MSASKIETGCRDWNVSYNGSNNAKSVLKESSKLLSSIQLHCGERGFGEETKDALLERWRDVRMKEWLRIVNCVMRAEPIEGD